MRDSFRERRLGPVTVRFVPATHRSADLEIGIALAGSAALFALALLPFEQISLLMPGCQFRAVTGIACMTCGATRCAIALSRFDLIAALELQPLLSLLAITGFIATPLAWLAWLLKLPRLRIRFNRTRGRVVFGATVVGIVVLNWLYLIAAGR